MTQALKIMSIFLYMGLPLRTGIYREHKAINTIKAIGSFYSEWYVPSSQMQSKKTCCYSFGVSSDLSFEVGILALSDHTIVFIDDSLSKSNIDSLQMKISQNKVVYVDDEQIYPLVPSKRSNLVFIAKKHRKSLIKNTVITPNDIVKILAKDEATCAIIHTFIEHKIVPAVMCIDFKEVDEGMQYKLTKIITEYGYHGIPSRSKGQVTFLRDNKLLKSIANNIEQVNRVQGEMYYYIYRADLFNTDPVITETRVYDLLLRYPLKEKVNYIATPWACLINKKIPFKDIVNNQVNGGFTLCQHVRYELILPHIKAIGLDTLFTPHVNKYYFGVRVLPFPHYPVNGSDPLSNKDLWYSFVGAPTHSVRKALFAMKHPANTVIKKRSGWHFFAHEKQQESAKNEYEALLARSRFSLCPRGVGASTIRFWESLQAGAIPVLLADDMQLPDGIDWEKCVVFIAEKDVHKIESILRNITSEQERKMRENCLKVFKEVCKGDNFINVIKWYIENNNKN